MKQGYFEYYELFYGTKVNRKRFKYHGLYDYIETQQKAENFLRSKAFLFMSKTENYYPVHTSEGTIEPEDITRKLYLYNDYTDELEAVRVSKGRIEKVL